VSGLTLGEIATALAFIAGIITACTVIIKLAAKLFTKTLQNALKPTNEKLDKLGSDIEAVGLSDCKNFIVNCLEVIERGEELSEIAKERFEENYAKYRGHYKANGYIKARVEEYRKAGKL